MNQILVSLSERNAGTAGRQTGKQAGGHIHIASVTSSSSAAAALLMLLPHGNSDLPSCTVFRVFYFAVAIIRRGGNSKKAKHIIKSRVMIESPIPNM